MKVSERILIIKNGAIGNFFLTLSEFYSIRIKFPEAYIEIMGNSETVKLK
jgi:ADP-heptose:LPS heptosyltransferase